ncbi:MAG: hypothetical protein HN410_20345, partial [Prolixibacteraceae bacterium]|nr:hypothetical protein [Prolixibacteraceae bacterium]
MQKQLLATIAAIVFTLATFAQPPEKMTYQAVIRNSSDALVRNATVSMRISILQGSVGGAVVYSESQSPVTNANGLVSIEIGGAGLGSIDWSAGPFFLKTETDPSGGGTNYTITGVSQLLSVPFALHAKTAETISGEIEETDPDFNSSVAAGITETDTANWNNKTGSYTETDPYFEVSVAAGIAGTDIANWNNKQNAITGSEVEFDNWDKNASDDFNGWYSKLIGRPTQVGFFTNDVGYLTTEVDGDITNEIQIISISNDTIYLSNGDFVKLPAETDPVFTAWDKNTGIAISESQISDLDHFTTSDETDPIFDGSIARGITATDTTNWNDKLDIEVDGDPSNEIQILSIGNDTIYLTNGGFVKLPAETDPVFTAWDKNTGIAISESQITDLDHFTTGDETDPVFDGSIAKGITSADTTNWNDKLDVEVDADPNNEIQILSIGNDTIYLTNGGFVKLPAETDPVYASWDKSTGIAISESQITDLDHFTTGDETDPIFDGSISKGITATDTSNWNNKLDVEVDADPSNEIQILSIGNDTIYLTNGGFVKLPAETDPVFTAWDKNTGIAISESQITDLDHFTTADETDPIFDGSISKGITATDTSNWNNKLDVEVDADPSNEIQILSIGNDTIYLTNGGFVKLPAETDPVFTAWDKNTGIAISESQITDLDHFTTGDETDPVFDGSIAKGITSADTTNWNDKLDVEVDADPNNEIQILSIGNDTIYLTNGGFVKLPAETDPVYASWDKSTGIAISESQITDLDHFTTADETDPVFDGSIAKGITSADTTNWNNKLDVEIDDDVSNEIQILSIGNDTIYLTNGGFVKLPAETDPVFGGSIAKGITATDTSNWNNKLDVEIDDDVSNEIQILSIGNDTIYLTN